MTQKDRLKSAATLINYYIKLYEKRYERKPIVNRYRDKFGYSDMLIDLSVDEVRDLLEFYFKTDNKTEHSTTWLFSNYDRLLAGKIEADKDEALRAKLREETRKRAEDGKSSAETN